MRHRRPVKFKKSNAFTPRSVGVLALLLLAWFTVAGLGGWLTSLTVQSWYPTLAKPAWNPPAWVFPPVWTTLYVLLALAGWRLWSVGGFARFRGAWALYGVQMGLNVAWSATFFARQNVGGGLAVLGALWGLAWIMGRLFWCADRRAAWLLAPYLIWISFALLLNARLWLLNG